MPDSRTYFVMSSPKIGGLNRKHPRLSFVVHTTISGGATYPFLEFPHQRHDFAHNLSVLTGDGGERIVMGQ